MKFETVNLADKKRTKGAASKIKNLTSRNGFIQRKNVSELHVEVSNNKNDRM